MCARPRLGDDSHGDRAGGRCRHYSSSSFEDDGISPSHHHSGIRYIHTHRSLLRFPVRSPTRFQRDVTRRKFHTRSQGFFNVSQGREEEGGRTDGLCASSSLYSLPSSPFWTSHFALAHIYGGGGREDLEMPLELRRQRRRRRRRRPTN